MKTEGQIKESKSAQELMKRIKEAVRRWYATVSVKELVANRALVAEIEAFERLLAGVEVVS